MMTTTGSGQSAESQCSRHVRFTPNSDQKWCSAANDAKCQKRTSPRSFADLIRSDLSETPAAHVDWRLAVGVVFLIRCEPCWHFEVFSYIGFRRYLPNWQPISLQRTIDHLLRDDRTFCAPIRQRDVHCGSDFVDANHDVWQQIQRGKFYTHGTSS